jgi:predicted ATPase/DNA-binding SARP family transcriptional activator
VTDTLTIRVLGPLTIERAGLPVVLGSRLQRRLLTTLVLARGATLSCDRLVDGLWGTAPPASPANALQSHVTRLRDALGDRDVVLTRPPGYALDVRRVEIDAVGFEAAVEQARARLDADPGEAARLLDEALGRWRGAAYVEMADGLAHAEAVRLERLRGDARLLYADALRRTEADGPAAAVLRRLLADEPLREDAAIALARTLAAAGDRVEALAVLRRYRTRLADDLGLDPTAAFGATERDLLRGDVPARPAPEPAGARPAPEPAGDRAGAAPRPAPRIGTATVGRDRAVEDVVAALPRSPVVTLVGPGGVGKTRVAAEVAARHHPAAWVDLSRVRAATDVAPAVADGIGIAVPTGTDAGSAIALALARFPGLVVIDNCEHLLDEVAALVDRALAHDGPARLLATTRERLDVPGEAVVPIDPLPVPPPARAHPDDPAIALFQARLASAGGAAVAPTEAARVVAAVDGLPLAIELAAARAAALPVATLLDRLPHHLDVLAGSGRRHGERQRALTEVIRWSYDLLEPDERRLFRCLSVFAGAFGPDEVERVCGDGRASTAAGLAGLVERSMVVRLDASRYRLLEPLRLFAAEQLDAATAAAVGGAHLAWALELADRVDAAMTGPDEVRIVPVVEAALPDLRAAHARACADGAGDAGDAGDAVARLAAGLHRFAYAQGRQDVLAWGEAPVLGRDPRPDADRGADGTLPHVLRARAAAVAAAWMGGRLEAAGALASSYATRVEEGRIEDPLTRTALAESLGDLRLMTGDLDGAARAFSLHLAAAEALGHDGLRSQALAGLAITHAFQGDHDGSERLARAAEVLAARDDVPSARALAAYALGEALADQRPGEALEAFDRSCTQAARVGARFVEGLARTADVALRGRHGDPEEALVRYEAALRVWHDTGADGLVLTTLRNLVVLLVRVADDAAAMTLDAATERLRTHDVYGEEVVRLERARHAAAARLGPERLAAARRRGATLGDLEALRRFGSRAIRSHLGDER